MEKRLLPLSIIMLAASIIFASIWVGNSLEKPIPTSVEKKVFSLSEVSEYLNMDEDEVLAIIQIEKAELEQSGSFTGKMFPYFVINNNKYFYKSEIDEWAKEISLERREYNTKEGRKL